MDYAHHIRQKFLRKVKYEKLNYWIKELDEWLVLAFVIGFIWYLFFR